MAPPFLPKRYIGKFFLTWKTQGFFATLQKALRFFRKKWTFLVWKWLHPFQHQRFFFTTGLFEFIPGLIKGKRRAVAKAKKLIQFQDIHADIAGQFVCLRGKECVFSGSRTVIMAHWDIESVIDPYVEHLCKHYKSLGFRVILVSAHEIHENDVLQRWQTWADAVIYRACDGYDFTSWKAAFACFDSLYCCEEIVLTNDSCFGPIGSFEPVFTRMATLDCDFWGLTYSNDHTPHLQSFYLVLRSNTIQHPALKKIIDCIPLSNDREKAIQFELSFGVYLTLHGLQGAAYACLHGPYKDMNPIFYGFKEAIEYGLPLIKRERAYTQEGFCTIYDLANKYPDDSLWKHIHNYVVRMGSVLPNTGAHFGIRVAYNTAGIGVLYKQYASFPQSVHPLYEDVSMASFGNAQSIDRSQTAVALHCFYPEALHTVMPHLACIPKHVHLYVTTDIEEKKCILMQQLETLHFTTMEVRVCPNRGWDMAPFFVGLQDVLLHYDAVLKIHVKKSPILGAHVANAWRNVLYQSLMGSKENVLQIMHALAEHPRLGVIAPPTFPPFALPIQGPNHDHMKKLLQRYDVDIPDDAAIDFPVGGMFWCKGKALKPWLALGLAYEDFEPSSLKQVDGTLAHALERLIFYGCGIENLTWTRLRGGEKHVN